MDAPIVYRAFSSRMNGPIARIVPGMNSGCG